MELSCFLKFKSLYGVLLAACFDLCIKLEMANKFFSLMYLKSVWNFLTLEHFKSSLCLCREAEMCQKPQRQGTASEFVRALDLVVV